MLGLNNCPNGWASLTKGYIIYGLQTVAGVY